MSKSALVAGGSGFIGSHLSALLMENSYKVTVVDNLVTGHKTNIDALIDSGLKFIEADICELPDFDDDQFDEIYNLASPASPVDFPRIPLFILNTAAKGHLNLLHLARQKGAKILFASSSEVYGEAQVHPQEESYWGNVNPVGVRSCYDEAKRYGEALSVAFAREHGVSIRMARIFNTYGPSMRPTDGRIIPNFFGQALKGEPLTIYGDGNQSRSFCYVSDLAAGLYALMQADVQSPVNLGNPIERTVLEMGETINKLTNNSAPHKYLPLPENDPTHRRPNISKAKQLLNWEPKVSLDEGLDRTHTYFKTVVLG